MDSQDSQEQKLLIAFQNIKRISSRTKSNDPIPHGEFVMLYAVHSVMLNAGALPETTECPGVMISRLSDMLQISRPAASQTVSTLEEKGYIRRVMSSTDRRVIYICLTAQGEAVLIKWRERYACVLNEIVEKVGREDIDQLIGLCDRLGQVMEEISGRLLV